MSILSIFVVIPVLMLLRLWLARNINQVRGVMVAGSTSLLALSVPLATLPRCSTPTPQYGSPR